MKHFKTQREYDIYVELAEALRDNMKSVEGRRLAEVLVNTLQEIQEIQDVMVSPSEED